MKDPRPAEERGQSKPGGASPIEVDCVIVGGGVAGLSAAVNMARMNRRVVVVDARDRFLWSHMIHNYLGFPDGIKAVELRRLGWRQAKAFGARLMIGQAVSAVREGDRFRFRVEPPPLPKEGRDPQMSALWEAADDPVEIVARSAILATGVMGHFPEFPGRDECVGRSLFWCIHCDGYESIDKAVGVVGHSEEAVQTALELLEFTKRVTIVSGRPEGFDVPESRLADLAENGIAAYSGDVAEYCCDEGRILALRLNDEAGTEIPIEQVYTVRQSVAANDLARQLGVKLDDIGQIVVTPEQHTNVPGVFAAGDATNLHDHQISAAVHEGNQAAAGANYHLYRPVQKSAGDRAASTR
jgi:thioredoxin reductase (NADPH)